MTVEDDLEGNAATLLPLDAYQVYSRMSFFALGATEYLRESWKRPKRHNQRLERAALWHTILLESECATALEPENRRILVPSATDVNTKYELQAGIRTVHATIPFSPEERQTLQYNADMRTSVAFENVDSVGVPPLAERWHEWLWMDDLGIPQTSVEALGASAVLAEGCGRLAGVLIELLDRGAETYDCSQS